MGHWIIYIRGEKIAVSDGVTTRKKNAMLNFLYKEFAGCEDPHGLLNKTDAVNREVSDQLFQIITDDKVWDKISDAYSDNDVVDIIKAWWAS